MITLGKTEEVHISIYHIGYASEGESSLFILHTAAGNILYSLVNTVINQQKYVQPMYLQVDRSIQKNARKLFHTYIY